MENKKIKGVSFVLYRPDKTILMQFRDEKSRLYPHTWCFPGGRCEGGEEPLNTVVRETREEYELKIEQNSCALILVQPHEVIADEIHYVFFCPIDAKQQPVLHEGKAMKWMGLEEIKSTPLGFGDDSIIPHLEEFLIARERFR